MNTHILTFLRWHVAGTLRILVALSLLLTPYSALSATVSLSIPDTIAGLGVDALITGLPGNAQAVLELQTPSTEVSEWTVEADASGRADTYIEGSATEEAGIYEAVIRKENGAVLTSPITFEVLPDRVHGEKSTIRSDYRNLEPDGKQQITITVTLRDQYGNVLLGRPVEIRGARKGDTIIRLDRETDRNGQQSFLFRTTVSGKVTLQAIDLLSEEIVIDQLTLEARAASAAGSEQRFSASLIETASAQAEEKVDRFEMTFDPSTLETDEVGSFTVEAVNKEGNIVESYVGTISIETSDPNATLPGSFNDNGKGEVTITPRERGKKRVALAVKFVTPSGAKGHTIRAHDRENGISGETMVIVNGQSAGTIARGITNIIPAKGSAVLSEFDLAFTARPYTNFEITVVPGETVFTDTDEDGNAAAHITVDPGQTAVTVRLQSQDGQTADSGNISYIVDDAPPEIETVTYSPESPETGKNTLVVVKAGEPRLTEVKMILESKEVVLTEQTKTPGVYQGLFTAPAAGSYQPAISATDSAGNTREILSSLVVAPKALAIVKNVKVEARANGVQISWDAITEEEIDGYRIYVSDTTPSEFAHTLETQSTTAIVAGLRPGATYYFALAGFIGSRESEKAKALAGVPLGTTLAAKPIENGIELTWEFPEAPANFLVEYGVGTLTEKRMLLGTQHTYTARDLLPGVEYAFRLTPITTTGDRLDELAATAQASPSGDTTKFHAAAGDPIPWKPGDLPVIPQPTHPGAPLIPSGLPSSLWWFLGALSLITFGLYLRRRKTVRVTQEFFRTMEDMYRR